jgi:hypothetical protein
VKITTGFIILAILVTSLLSGLSAGCENKEIVNSTTVNNGGNETTQIKPSIDINLPAKMETATFSFG